MPDTTAVFWLDGCSSGESKDELLAKLITLWPGYKGRRNKSEKSWMADLNTFLDGLVEKRVLRVQAWVNSNLPQSGPTNASVEELRRALDSRAVELRRSVQLCGSACKKCLLQCLKSRFHEGEHDCTTNHLCPHACQFVDQHEEPVDSCSLP